MSKKQEHKVLSLFSNIGVAEACLEDIGVDVVLANELIEKRANLYQEIYKKTHMICGDITNSLVKEKIVKEAIDKRVDVIMATPPCQGMSTAGQKKSDDERNRLICPTVEMIRRVSPKYVFIENVPQFYQTTIRMNAIDILIPTYISNELSSKYIINQYVINTEDFSVPQSRERAIILMTRKDVEKVWVLPSADSKKITMRDAIGNIPTIDPFVDDVSKEELKEMFPKYYEREKMALSISPWNRPPHHVKRQVEVMQHTPTGCTAFDNAKYFPIKKDGKPVKGYHNTYKRQNWDTPAYTITMDNRKISSQNNVHPGRIEQFEKDGERIFSDARALTLYEIMLIMSLPKDWPIPEKTPEAFLRRIIGEGIPPLFVKKVFKEIV